VELAGKSDQSALVLRLAAYQAPALASSITQVR
jgi:hypothetical protein